MEDSKEQGTAQVPAVVPSTSVSATLAAFNPAAAWTDEQLQLLKDTVAKGADDNEFKVFLHYCRRTGLDPFLRQIFLVKRYDSETRRDRMTVQTGIDGFRYAAERTGEYAGSDEPQFVFAKEGDKIPRSATVTVYRFIRDQRVGFTATAFYDEYAQHKSDGTPTRFWKNMPKGQLAKCAEALAFRKAFPHALSGIYTSDEMQQADRPATDAQLELIRKLCKSTKVPDDVANKALHAIADDNITADDASTWINTLKSHTDDKSDKGKTPGRKTPPSRNRDADAPGGGQSVDDLTPPSDRADLERDINDLDNKHDGTRDAQHQRPPIDVEFDSSEYADWSDDELRVRCVNFESVMFGEQPDKVEATRTKFAGLTNLNKLTRDALVAYTMKLHASFWKYHDKWVAGAKAREKGAVS